jgi:uncharacterized membrane protein
MWIFGAVIGLLIGASTFGFDGWFLGAIIGGFSGLFFKSLIKPDFTEINARLKDVDEAIQKLNRRIDTLQRVDPIPQTAIKPVIADTPVAEIKSAPLVTEPEKTAPENKLRLDNTAISSNKIDVRMPESKIPAMKVQSAPVVQTVVRPPASTYKVPEVKVAEPHVPNWLETQAAKVIQAVKLFIFGGNTLVKVGSLILFLGLAFLLRYAASQFTVPIELRYGGVAASALGLLIFGWRLRISRRDYALVIQGLAIAVLYLTLYAAMKLHPLLPTVMGFALMVVVCACSVVLAVKQNSLALAVAGSLGGFATPVLASSGAGSHVALFSYIALLDAGIMAVAWFRAWRVLNLVGFFGTFGLFMAWFERSWSVVSLVSAELFLLLFFAIYVLILLRFTHHLSLTREMQPNSDAERDGVLLKVAKRVDYIDGTLAFGVPLITFGLHAQMVNTIEFGASFGALFLGAVYLGLALALQKLSQGRYLLLFEVFIALGVVFASLAIPLGLEPQWTASAWALEAVGIFWIGIRQQRPLARIFAVLLLIGSVINFFRTLYLRPHDIDTLGSLLDRSVFEGSIFGAILIAFSLIFVHWLLRKAPEGSISKSEREFSWLPALAGTLMIYLLVPMLLPFEYCGMAWGALGLLTVYLSLRFVVSVCTWAGLLIQLFAGLSFVTTLHGGDLPALVGSGHGALVNGYSGVFAALLIALSLLFSYWVLRKMPEGEESKDLRDVAWLPALAGTLLIYLLPPLLLAFEYCGMAWGVLGLLTLFLALRLMLSACVWAGLLVQLFAGIAFVTTLHGGETSSVLGNGYSGLFSALIIGGTMLAAVWMASSKLRESEYAIAGAMQAIGIVTVVGLSLLNLAFLFVLPMQSALTAWALTSTLIVALALRIGNRIALWFALLLELVAGLMVMSHRGGLTLYTIQDAEKIIIPFQNSGWWSALVFSLCGFVGAWLLLRVERKKLPVPIPNVMLLVWASLWWGGAWIAELNRWLPDNKALPAMVVMLIVTQLLWWAVARWQDWSELRRFTYSHLPLAFMLSLMALVTQAHPFENFGWLVWPLAVTTHFFLLYAHENSSNEKVKKYSHIVGVWWILLFASFETRWHFSLLGDQYSAWPKLGWALIPLAYLWWAGRWTHPSPWPFTHYLDAYRRTAALPVVILLAVGLFVLNFASSGAANPLPYVPLLNPLEITLIAGMLVIVQWVKNQAGLTEILFMHRAAVLGYGFLVLTAGVFRAVHHWAGVPWRFEQLIHTTLLQVVLSVVWTVVASMAMLIASKYQKRALWMAGAVLIAVVVAKLFLVELSQSGTIERIVSFMVVGVLLLLMGYFAPVPPKKIQQKMEASS